MAVYLIIYVFCKICVQELELEIVLKKLKQVQVHKAYKTRKSTMSWNGNSEENMYLSRIYLALAMDVRH